MDARVKPDAARRLALTDFGESMLSRRGPILIVAAGLVGLALWLDAPWSLLAAGSAGALLCIAALVIERARSVGVSTADHLQQAGVPLRGVADALPDPAIVLDRNGEVVVANDGAHDLFRDLKAGVHISSAIRTPEFLDALVAAVTSVTPVTVMHVERVPVGRRLAITVAPLLLDHGETRALLVLLRDLTEQERMTQMRADFIANASHELRTPLASLRGFIETLQGSARQDLAAQTRFLGIMAEQAGRMSRLIDDLLALSRVEMTAHLPAVHRIDVDELAAHVAETLEPLANAAGVRLAVTRLGGPAYVRGDRDELVQVFQNLIHNAIKYSRSGGEVRIRTARREESGTGRAWVTVAIEDDGVGIAPEHLPRLTERFYRVDAASSREKGGTGLGLAIVKHVLNRHRGDLDIRSEDRKGSVFTVQLREVAKEQGGESG